MNPEPTAVRDLLDAGPSRRVLVAPVPVVPVTSGASLPVLDAAALGRPLGTAATFLQLSSGFCAPCRATRRVLERVVATAEGVAHVEVDVAHRGDLAALLDVTVTPTVLVLDAAGTPVARVEGVPSLAQARATVAALQPRP